MLKGSPHNSYLSLIQVNYSREEPRAGRVEERAVVGAPMICLRLISPTRPTHPQASKCLSPRAPGHKFMYSTAGKRFLGKNSAKSPG